MNKALEFLKQQIGKEASLSPSPLMRWLNPILLEVDEGKISMKYTVRKEMTNPIGILHGGISAAIIDDTIGAALSSFGEAHFYSTINNTIDYFSAAKENESIIANAFILKKGRQLAHAQCEIWLEDKSRMIARGQSNLLKTEIAKTPVL